MPLCQHREVCRLAAASGVPPPLRHTVGRGSAGWPGAGLGCPRPPLGGTCLVATPFSLCASWCRPGRPAPTRRHLTRPRRSPVRPRPRPSSQHASVLAEPTSRSLGRKGLCIRWLPPNTSALLLQPADQGYIRHLKRALHRQHLEKIQASAGGDPTAVTALQRIPEAIECIADANRGMAPQVLKSFWRRLLNEEPLESEPEAAAAPEGPMEAVADVAAGGAPN